VSHESCIDHGWLGDIAPPHFGVKFPQKNSFWGVNRLFQARLVKYCEFHIIETTASISTKFCTTIETTKWVIVGGPNTRPPNPRWRTAAILQNPLNRHISAMV